MILFNLWVAGLLITYLFQDVDSFILFDKKYTAAVVEYHVKYNGTMESHAEEYASLINEIKKKHKADIIVFPENGLTANLWIPNRESLLYYATFIPEPGKNINPCIENKKNTQYSDTLRKISCAANNNETYVIINLYEKELCTEELQEDNDPRPCASDGWNFYNTDVVFNRKGEVVARYRKINLFGEYLLNTTAKPELVTFQTDFCVTFGIFTCFDILFDMPANHLVTMNVKDFIFPTRWFSELPFLTAVQAQYMWAYTHKVNFMGAGVNMPSLGSTGSSIYNAKDNNLKAIMSDGKETKIIIKTLRTSKNITCLANSKEEVHTSEEDVSSGIYTSDPEEHNTNGVFMKIDDLKLYESILLNKMDLNKEFNKTLQYGSLQCKFSIKADFHEKSYLLEKKTHTTTKATDVTDWIYNYRLVAFNGVRSWSGISNGGIQVCGLIACTNNTLASCGHRFPSDKNIVWPFTFTQIIIEGNFENKTVPYLNSLTGQTLLPIPSTYTSSNKRGHFKLTGPYKPIYTFAIYARNYERDNEEVTTKPNSSTNLSVPVIWIVVQFIVLKISNLKMV